MTKQLKDLVVGDMLRLPGGVYKVSAVGQFPRGFTTVIWLMDGKGRQQKVAKPQKEYELA